jgi:hypothetical protein
MSTLRKRYYGYRYSEGVSLDRAAAAVAKQLGVVLNKRYSSFTGDYYRLGLGGEDELVVHMNDSDGVPDIWWCAEFSPIIHVASRSKATHVSYERKLMAIPGIELSWKFGDRRRRFVRTKEGRNVSFIVWVNEGLDTIAEVHADGVSFATLMRVSKLERDRELWGTHDLSREQVDRLKVTLPRDYPAGSDRFVLNLNSIAPAGSGEYEALSRPRVRSSRGRRRRR